jgi:site-specific DNA-adenine methylase
LRYPPPEYDRIVEPFAGGAGYSLEYWDHQVTLFDLDVRVVAVWDYLIHATEKDVLSIPVGITHVDEIPDSLGQAVRWLVGWWMQPAGAAGPAKSVSSWSAQHHERSDVWSEKCRARLASQVPYIHHWRVEQASYEDIIISESPTTWFVDAPYQQMGVYYKHGAESIDYGALGEWCRSLNGQVIVCENAGAEWLPFTALCDMVGGSMKRTRQEVMWTTQERIAA